jgi:hypothetical protein
MLCDSFTHICTLWINQSNLILFYVLLENIIHYDQFCQFEHAWVSMFDKHHPFWYLLCNAHLKKNMFLCLCQPSLWAICQCTCLGLWPMGITLFPYLLWMPIFCGLIPCPSGIVESRYSTRRTLVMSMASVVKAMFSRIEWARARASQPKLFKPVSVACKDRLWY